MNIDDDDDYEDGDDDNDDDDDDDDNINFVRLQKAGFKRVDRFGRNSFQ